MRSRSSGSAVTPSSTSQSRARSAMSSNTSGRLSRTRSTEAHAIWVTLAAAATMRTSSRSGATPSGNPPKDAKTTGTSKKLSRKTCKTVAVLPTPCSPLTSVTGPLANATRSCSRSFSRPRKSAGGFGARKVSGSVAGSIRDLFSATPRLYEPDCATRGGVALATTPSTRGAGVPIRGKRRCRRSSRC